MSPQVLGYASSGILLLTIGNQVHKQWQSGTSKGVSTWLFFGQLLASAGFTAYSILIGNPIFVLTNACLFVAAILGLAIVLHHRRTERTAQGDRAACPDQ